MEVTHTTEDSKGSFSLTENKEIAGEMTYSKAGNTLIIIDHTDVSEKFPEEKKRLVKAYQKWTASAEASIAGKDYQSGEVDSNQPPRVFWTEIEGYKPHFDEFEKRPEYESWIKKAKVPPIVRKKE